MTATRTTAVLAALGSLLVVQATACFDAPDATAPAPRGPILLDVSGPVRRQIHWTAHDIFSCPLGRGQLQSVYPLDEAGNLILLGRVCRDPVVPSYQVFDLSAGEPLLVADVVFGPGGSGTGAHSPRGSSVGFGGAGTNLVVYDGSFRTIPIPCPESGCRNITGVWAGSPSHVWILSADPRTRAGPGRILRFDGTNFTVEHEGGILWGIWGFGERNPATMYAVGDRILRRDINGTWREVLGPEALRSACTNPLDRVVPLFRVMGLSPEDVWAVGFFPCILRFDGRTWVEMPVPPNATALGGVWVLDARGILVSGQGGGDLDAGLVSLWGSVDGGQTWTQFDDPLFTTLSREPRGNLPLATSAFFALAATQGATRVYAPIITGTLLVGAPSSALVSGVSPAAARSEEGATSLLSDP